MPLPGGAADKLGNIYEGHWTVFCMVDVMDEKADSIRLEPPGIDGIEFWLRRKERFEYHQVKRQTSGGGRWTISALEGKKIHVLSHFWKHLKNPDIFCVFVSTQDADELRELADRSRSATSFVEFENNFLSKKLSKNLDNLSQKWENCSKEEAYQALKSIEIETVGENFIVKAIESRLAALVEGDTNKIRLQLTELADNNIHHELTAQDIWHDLEKEGYRRRDWAKDNHVLAAVEKANHLYLSPLQDIAIPGQVIPRTEAQLALNKLTATDGKGGVLLVGEAGMGKSGVIYQILQELKSNGKLFLAFRVDNLNPVVHPDHIGKQLELPASPAIVLANIAQKRNCILVIDQLDAVSLASGRNSQFFDCVNQIIEQTKAHPNIRLLIACRKFDLDNDNRIQRLTGEHGLVETVEIKCLPDSEVKDVVTKLDLKAATLSQNQLKLLSVPLHLSLLAAVAKDSSKDILKFTTSKELYDQFWKYKRQQVKERLLGVSSVQWTEVIDTLCDYMSNKQQQSLSAPETIVDDYRDDANAMVSEHVLISDGKRLRFFHEGFFDYAFARRFSGRGQDLLEFLLASEQHLFRRAQVRQILLHQRDYDFDQYLDSLRQLITRSDIRFHIKQVVLAWLATLSNPQEEEWRVIEPLISESTTASNTSISQHLWYTLNRSLPWFQLLDELGIIEQWLKDDSDERIDHAIALLSIRQREIPDRVAELLEPYVSVSQAWDNRFYRLVQRSKLGIGERFFKLFLRLINQGIFDQPEVRDNYTREFWSIIYSLPENRPDWACQAISCYLNHYLDLRIAAGKPNLSKDNDCLIPESGYYDEILVKSSQKAPKAYIKHILPWMFRVMELTAKPENNPPCAITPVWYYRSYSTSYKPINIQGTLLKQMEVALSDLATKDPEDFARLVKQQLGTSKFETIQFLLIRAYTSNGERFADKAIDLICEQPGILTTGYSLDNDRLSVICELLKETTQYCSEEKLRKLEYLIINYYSDGEKSAIGRRDRGYSQLFLLDAIASSRLTKESNLRLEEWRRKFGEIEPLKPSVFGSGFIGSPIPQNAIEKMTDEQLLSAIAKYNTSERFSWFERDGKFVGSAREFSRLLENQVKKEPLRFVKLIERFPDNTNLEYFNGVLRGIAEVGLDVDSALRVCQRCHRLPNRPCGRWISDLIGKLADIPWPQEALEILTWYALEDPEPEQELWRTNTQSGDVEYDGDVLNAGMNSTRGSAVVAIAKLISTDKNRAYSFQEPLDKIVEDSSIAVRACAAEALMLMLNYDRDLAVQLFQRLCNTEDALLGTVTVDNFLYYALQNYFEELASILERMIMSELPKVAEIGAKRACVESLRTEEAGWLAELCLSGTKVHKKAAAQVFASNLSQAHLRKFCEDALVQLFHDSDQEVHSQAAMWFYHFQGEELGEYQDLIKKFVDSPAFANGFDNLLGALEKTTAKLPEVTYTICNRFIQDLAAENASSGRLFRGHTDSVSKLLVKLYSQSKDELQSKCLDLIDQMAQLEVYFLDKALEDFEGSRIL